MRLKVVVHEAEEGDYWAEVPSISGCATQGETFEELEGCLSVDLDPGAELAERGRVIEIAV